MKYIMIRPEYDSKYIPPNDILIGRELYTPKEWEKSAQSTQRTDVSLTGPASRLKYQKSKFTGPLGYVFHP